MLLTYVSGTGTLIMADLGHVTREEEAFLVADARLADRAKVAKSLAWMAVQERRMMATATGEQQAIGWGTWVWHRFDPPPGAAATPACTVYGQIYTAAEMARREHAAAAQLTAAGEAHREPAVSLAGCHEAHALGWRYGRWYSVIEPEGEPGANHIALLTQISRAQFEAARAAGWPEVPPWL